MRTKSTGMRIRNLGNDAYTGDSPPEFWRMPCLFIANAKKHSGKTALITSALHRLKEAGCMDVIIAISDTFDSNLKMMKNLNIKREHVFSPNDPEAIKKVINIIEAERDDLQRYRDELERYKELDKHLENASIWDDQYLTPELLDLYNENTGEFERPTHWLNGKRAAVGVIIDDAQSSKLLSDKAFRNLCIKHRHIGSFSDGSAPIGCSLFIAVQNYTCQGNEGIPKAIRGNADVFAIWRTGNTNELDLLMTELSGMIPKEKLMKAYTTVMNKDPTDKHACLVFETNPKNHAPSPFRIGLTDWLILDDD